MTIQIIVGVLLLAALAYAWYTERTRRREAELERDLATRRIALDGVNKKLDETKDAYVKAEQEFRNSIIPADMLEHIGKPVPPDGKQATRRPEAPNPITVGPVS